MSRKKFLKKLIVASLSVGNLIFLPAILNFDAGNLQIMSVAHAEIANYTASDTAMFDFGEDNPQIVNTVKNMARKRAIKAAQEKAGVYITGYSKIVNGRLTANEISAVTNNISEVLEVGYEKFFFQAQDAKGNPYGKVGIMYKATVTVKIDTDGINEYLNRDAQDKSKIIQQDINLQESFAEINNKFEELRVTATDKTPEQVKSELQKIYNEILAEEKITEGNKSAYHKDYQGAISKYNEAIQINPNNTRAWKNIELIGERKIYVQMISEYDKTIQTNPKNAEAYYNRGVAYEALGKTYEHSVLGKYYFYRLNFKQDKANYKKALADYNKAIKLNPNFAEAYNARASRYIKSQKYKTAIKDLNKAIQINPNYAEAYNNRGYAYYWASDFLKRNYQLIIDDYNKAIQLNLNYAEAYYNRGYANIGLRNYEQTIEDYSKAIEIDPNNVSYYGGRGYVYYNYLNDYEKAIKDYKKRIEINPNEPSHYSDIAYVYQKWGKDKEAREYEAKAKELELKQQ